MNILNNEPVLNPVLENLLNRDWTRSSLYTENERRTHFEAPYVHEIAKLRKEKAVLCNILSQYANNLDMTQAIEYKLIQDSPQH